MASNDAPQIPVKRLVGAELAEARLAARYCNLGMVFTGQTCCLSLDLHLLGRRGDESTMLAWFLV